MNCIKLFDCQAWVQVKSPFYEICFLCRFVVIGKGSNPIVQFMYVYVKYFYQVLEFEVASTAHLELPSSDNINVRSSMNLKMLKMKDFSEYFSNISNRKKILPILFHAMYLMYCEVMNV